jgi:predicted PP-loop superfamily ATPase
MRLQLKFKEKPEPEVREILKSNGFKWSLKNGCWQRQLTGNARYSARRVIRELEKLKTA